MKRQEPDSVTHESRKRAWTSCVWFLAVGCGGGTGTDLNQIVSEAPISDAAAPDAAAGWGQAASYLDPFDGAPAYAAQMGISTHNAGMACLQPSCHGGTAGTAPRFFLGGTAYLDYQGTKPAVGVEVRIVDSAGHAVSAYAGPEGNFFVSSGAENGVTFPAAIGARDANTSRPMITAITGIGMDSCAQTTCHVAGGGPMTGTGNYFPIHVP
jgi:hypothetical protein